MQGNHGKKLSHCQLFARVLAFGMGQAGLGGLCGGEQLQALLGAWLEAVPPNGTAAGGGIAG